MLTYKEYGDYLLGDENTYGTDNLRKAFYVISKMFKNIEENTMVYTDDRFRQEIDQLKFELLKERKKLQAVNSEYHKNARQEGRYELFLENIAEAINRLPPVQIKPTVYKSVNQPTTGVLWISDAHYGRSVKLMGLFGEVVNEYSPEIFKTRMWKLLSDLENDLYDMPIDKLDIIDCGDNIEGILRVGDSLMNLATGVVDSALDYAEFMATWVIEAHNRLGIPIRYVLTGGNHDLIRILSSQKDFSEENVAKFIYKHISLRVENSKLHAQLKGCPFVAIDVEPYNEVVYQNYYGMNVLAYHGETRNMKEDIEFFENYYQIDVDLLVGAHLHRSSSETIGVGYMGDREIIRLPSICGNDIYSKQIRKLSRAGARFMTFTESGKNWEKSYFLS